MTVTDDGTYTYTPTEVARQAATGSTTDAFVATVHSGLSTRSVTVVVPVDPGPPRWQARYRSKVRTRRRAS